MTFGNILEVTTPHPGTREYVRQIVRLADLTVMEDIITDVRFEQCEIVGPAVVAPLEGVTMRNSRFDAPDSDALFWIVPSSREVVIGAIGLVRVEFFSCKFSRVGLAIPEHKLEEYKQGFGLG